MFIESSKRRKMPLWQRVFTGLFAGVVVGLSLHYSPTGWGGPDIAQTYFYPIGELFVRLIKMLIVPLVFSTLVSGVVAMKDPERLGKLGLRTIVLYLLTTFFAVWLGLAAGVIFEPGTNAEISSEMAAQQAIVHDELAAAKTREPYSDQFVAIIPLNPFEALASGALLSVIFFAVLLGVGILFSGENGLPVAKLFDSTSEIMLKITTMIMSLAPYGVMALMTWITGTQGAGVLTSVGMLLFALYIACLGQILLVYGLLIVRGILRMPLPTFFKGIASAFGVAYSTVSSSATLPVSISCAEEKLGVEKSIAGSVLPIGATINMDGTAIYLGIVALFAAQAFGLPLTFNEYAMIAITATLMSIGAAGVPSAGLLMAAGVLSVIGLGEAEITLVIAMIYPFDRFLDMMRTATNVTGDIAIACTVEKWLSH